MQHTFTTSSSWSRLVCDSSTLREAWQSGSPCADAGGALRVTVQPNLICIHTTTLQVSSQHVTQGTCDADGWNPGVQAALRST